MQESNKLDLLRHSTAHLLASAISTLYPSAKNTIGPAVENKFYYDFDFGEIKITEEDFPKIEAQMHEMVRNWKNFERHDVYAKEALEEFSKNEYKCELIREFEGKGEEITIYQSGNFRDLCKGGHIENPSENIKFFKLLSIAGAYWRGNEKNKMLTRIYGTAFFTQEELDNYLQEIIERKKFDHRELNKILDLYTQSDLVGKGLIMYTPNGTIVKNELKRHLLKICKKYGAQEVDIPHMAKIDLYKISGHADKFSHELFKVVGHYDEEMVLKPVNCPHHTQIYASKPRSYKELPIAYVESTQQHRDEKPGSMSGLYRSKSFEVDDGHTFCTPEQLENEVKNLIKTIEEFYTSLNMWGNHWVSLSFKDPKAPEKYIGSEEDWNASQELILKLNSELKLNGKIMEGEAALYGPKIDFMVKDSQGNDRQLGTIQIDFAMPKRFGLTYTDRDGQEKTPVMIHRAILGSYQRFIAGLLENSKGNLPLWLAPIQVEIITVSEKFNDYAEDIKNQLLNLDIRCQISEDNETLSNKIRKAQAQKIPYMLVVGQKELDKNSVNIRRRNSTDQETLTLAEFIKHIQSEIVNKKN